MGGEASSPGDAAATGGQPEGAGAPDTGPAGAEGRGRPIGSRERLLDAAVELVVEHHSPDVAVRDVFSYLTPGAVAERAGLSRGLIYHHWGDPDTDGSAAFTRFLNAVAGALLGDPAVHRDVEALVDLLPDNLSDIITVLTRSEFERASGPDNARTRAGLALTLYGAAPKDQPTESLERLTRLYTRIFDKIGREPVPPLQVQDVVFAIIAVADGMSVNYLAAPERVTRQYEWTPTVPQSFSDAPWTLFAIIAESIALNMTRPVEGNAD